jgi:hypothetical protein
MVCTHGLAQHRVSENDILGHLNALSEQDRLFFDRVLLEDIYNDLEAIDALIDHLGVDAAKEAFANRYRELCLLLIDQRSPEFLNLSDIRKLQVSVQRQVMASISIGDVQSPYYLISEEVFEELFGTSHQPVDNFKALTWEPLLREIHGVQLTVPLTAMATVGLAALSKTKAKPILLVGATLTGWMTLTGCSSVNEFWKEHGESISAIILQIIRLWAYIEENQNNFQTYLQGTTDDFYNLLAQLEAVGVEFTESVKRQLYSAIFVTITDFLIGYLLNDEIEQSENNAYLESTGLSEDDFNTGDLDEEMLSGDIQDLLKSIQFQVIWSKFVEAVRKYVIHPGLAQAIINAADETKKALMVFIYDQYKRYEIIWNTIEILVREIKRLTEKKGESFDPEKGSDRKDWKALDIYVAGLMDWILAAESPGSGDSGGSPGSGIRILGPEERKAITEARMSPLSSKEVEDMRRKQKEGR